MLFFVVSSFANDCNRQTDLMCLLTRLRVQFRKQDKRFLSWDLEGCKQCSSTGPLSDDKRQQEM